MTTPSELSMQRARLICEQMLPKFLQETSRATELASAIATAFDADQRRVEELERDRFVWKTSAEKFAHVIAELERKLAEVTGNVREYLQTRSAESLRYLEALAETEGEKT